MNFKQFYRKNNPNIKNLGMVVNRMIFILYHSNFNSLHFLFIYSSPSFVSLHFCILGSERCL